MPESMPGACMRERVTEHRLPPQHRSPVGLGVGRGGGGAWTEMCTAAHCDRDSRLRTGSASGRFFV
eukprot:4178002-Prymnesium_polylepis.1